MREAITRAVEARADYVVEYRTLWPDGSIHWILARGSAFYESNGTPVRMIGVTLDITARLRVEEVLKEREKMFRVLADAVPDFMWITDAEGRCEFLNQRWFDYTGMSREQSVDLCWRTPQHPEDADRYFAAWQQAREAGNGFEAELRYRRADGVYRWFLCRALPPG